MKKNPKIPFKGGLDDLGSRQYTEYNLFGGNGGDAC